MSSIRYSKPPSQLTNRGWWKSIGFLGPGIIVASVTIGTGETIFASREGAIFGYGVLWCLVLGVFLKFIQIYASSRYMMISGEHPMQSWRYLPGPRGWLPVGLMLITIICLPFLLAGLSLSVGSIITWTYRGDALADLTVRQWASGLILLAALVSWNQSYRRLEKTQTVIVTILLTCVLIAALACKPDVMAVLSGMFVPSVPTYQPWIQSTYPHIAAQPSWIELITYIGIIGGGLPAYIGYLGFLRDKKWGLFSERDVYYHSSEVGFPAIDAGKSNQENSRGWLRAIKIDVGGSFVAVFVFSAAFMVLGAVILHPAQLIPDKMDLLTHQERFLSALSPYLIIFYRVGIITAIGGTLFATFDVWTKSVYEGILSLQNQRTAISVTYVKKWIIGFFVIWIGYYWSPLENPITVVSIPALLGGTTGCGVWCLGVAWADRRNLPPEFRMQCWFLVILIFSGLTLLGSGLLGFYYKFLG
jgi:Mn2+/Fe2+ NRAMP family transporter